MLEYFDHDDCVLLVLGKPEAEAVSTSWGRQSSPSATGTPYEVLAATPNRMEICPIVSPGRITLDRMIGAFNAIPDMEHKQAMLDALELISIKRGIFPQQWAVTHPTSPQAVRVVTPADGLMGVTGEVQGGQIQMVPQNPGVQTPQAIDRIERNIRVGSGISAEMGGESPTNVRTARRGADVLGSQIDMAIGEDQEILARSLEAENVRAIALMKAYYGGKKTSFYVPRSGKPNLAKGETYTPDDAFETDWHVVKYSMPGSDAASIPIELGQRTSTGEMSMQTSREIDPFIEDPIREQNQVELEGLRRGILGGLEQQLAAPPQAGGIDSIVVARIAEHRAANPDIHIEDAMIAVHKQMQAEQAAAQQGSAWSTSGAVPQGTPPPGAPDASPDAGDDGCGRDNRRPIRAIARPPLRLRVSRICHRSWPPCTGRCSSLRPNAR